MGNHWASEFAWKTKGGKSGFNAELQAYEVFELLKKIIEKEIEIRIPF